METLQRQALLVEIERLVVEANSGLHGGAAFLEGLAHAATFIFLFFFPQLKTLLSEQLQASIYYLGIIKDPPVL